MGTIPSMEFWPFDLLVALDLLSAIWVGGLAWLVIDPRKNA